MKKLVVFSVAALALSHGFAQAADMPVKAKPLAPEWTWRIMPSLSAGYAWGGDTNITFSAVAAGVAGVNKIDVSVPTSGPYIAAELPVALTDRLTLTLDGRWIFLGNREATAVYNNGVASRAWDGDDRGWGTVNLLLSYSVLKNAGAVKDISPVIGFRWDRYRLGFNNAHNVAGIVSVPADTADFKMNTYAPVFGITATFAGFRSGNLGGDIKVGVFGSPFLWGDMSYTETFGTTTTFNFNADRIRGSFITVSGEVDLFSARIGPRSEAKLAATAQYTRLNTHDTASLVSTGVFPGTANFDFSAKPHVFTLGLKGSVAF